MILLTIIVLTRTLGRQFQENRSGFIGVMVLSGLFSIGAMNIEGFASANNIKSMLLFASFLGIASIGQTLVALLGGLDLSIPFIIGAANVGLLYLIGLGVPPWLATIIVLSDRRDSGRHQRISELPAAGTGADRHARNRLCHIRRRANHHLDWFSLQRKRVRHRAALALQSRRNERLDFRLAVPPVIAIWLAIVVILIVGMRYTVYGRYLYALGVNRTSAKRVMISEPVYWVMMYAVSGFFAAMAGGLLLGWSGGGFIGVGDPYLFLTLAAVVVGGTSLLGGQGGYGFTVIGVLVLQVLSSFLIGIGLEFEWQQFIFGLLILPMVALYARSPHIRTQI